MLNFYGCPEMVIVGLIVLAALAAVLQFWVVIDGLRGGRRGAGDFWNAAFDGMLLFAVGVMLYLLTLIEEGYFMGIIYDPGRQVLRGCAFGLLAAAALGCAVCRRRLPVLALLPAAAVIPVAAEGILGRAYPAAFGAALGVFALYALASVIRSVGKAHRSLSYASVPEALDKLDAGILFSPEKGDILLMNDRMQRFMAELTGSLTMGAEAFFDFLQEDPGLLSCRRYTAPGTLIFELPDRTVVKCERTRFTFEGKAYQQVTATDVTRTWQLAETLKEENAALLARQRQLGEALANMAAFSDDEQRRELESRVHDVLGHRMAMLLATLREKRPGDAACIRDLGALQEELCRGSEGEDFALRFGRLTRAMDSIGVEVALRGSPPDDAARAAVFSEIALEAVTNAVRHGLATRVTVAFEGRGGSAMTVRDNGGGARDGYVEGGGLSGMRRRLAAHGGCLEIDTAEGFVIRARLPEEEEDL